MRTRRLVTFIAVGVLGMAVVVGAVLWTPGAPVPEARAAVATELASALPVLDELGVNLWRDGYVAGCRHISLEAGGRFQDPAGGCGDAAPFDSTSQAAWDRVALTLADMVPGGRVRSVLVVDGTVTFIAVPRNVLGMDAPFMRWVWTWNQDAEADPGLPPHWQFKAEDAALI